MSTTSPLLGQVFSFTFLRCPRYDGGGEGTPDLWLAWIPGPPRVVSASRCDGGASRVRDLPAFQPRRSRLISWPVRVAQVADRMVARACPPVGPPVPRAVVDGLHTRRDWIAGAGYCRPTLRRSSRSQRGYGLSS